MDYINTTHTTLGVKNSPQGTVNFATTLTVDALNWQSAWWALNSITEQIFGTFVKVVSINESRNTEQEVGTYSFSVNYSAVPSAWYAKSPDCWNVQIDTAKLAVLSKEDLAILDNEQ